MKMATDQRTQNDLRVEEKSNALAGVSVGLCVGGGIAALESPKLARELRRMGAKVRFIVTEAALDFVGRTALEWSSANQVTLEPSGLAQHIAGEDLVLVFPATADLIGKAANGICPDACSTYIQSALGEKLPLFFLPTMHDSLRNSPAFKNNVTTLEAFPSVYFLPPRVEEGKWKAPSPFELALELAFRFNRLRLKNHHGTNPTAVVTLGGTHSNIDVARILSNRSSGTLGALLIRNLLERGISVTALCGNMSARLENCSGLNRLEAAEFDQMQNQLKVVSANPDISALFHLAAVSDYAVEKSFAGKISSSTAEIELKLKRLPKLIALSELKNIEYKVGCKFTASNDESEMSKARRLLIDHKLNSVLWNWGESAFGNSSSEDHILIQDNGLQTTLSGKAEIAQRMVDDFINFISSKRSKT